MKRYGFWGIILTCFLAGSVSPALTRSEAGLKLLETAGEFFLAGNYTATTAMCREAIAMGLDEAELGRCLALKAEALLILGDSRQAKQAINDALYLLDGSIETFTVSRLYFLKSGVLASAGESEEAEHAAIKGLFVLRKHLGIMHPRIAIHLLRMAQSYMQNRQLYLAERCLFESLRITLHHWGAEHRLTATVLHEYRALLRNARGTEYADTFVRRFNQLMPRR